VTGVQTCALPISVTDDGRVIGVITRADFFRSVAQRFLERASPS
jgi:predicted transcriptional regulator